MSVDGKRPSIATIFNHAEPMNLHSRKGSEVVFTGMNGYPHQLERASKFLEVGTPYVVASVDVGNSSSTVKLEGVEGSFNTVHFVNKEAYDLAMSVDHDVPDEVGVDDEFPSP